MSLEKKLGVTFVGILFVTFCCVLAMKLTDRGSGDKIDINVGPPIADTPPPEASSQTKPTFAQDGNRTAQPGSMQATPMQAAPVQPRTSGFVNSTPPATMGNPPSANRYSTPTTTQPTPPPFAQAAPTQATPPSSPAMAPPPTVGGDRYASTPGYAPSPGYSTAPRSPTSPAAATPAGYGAGDRYGATASVPSPMMSSAPPAVSPVVAPTAGAAAAGNPLRGPSPPTEPAGNSIAMSAPSGAPSSAGFATPNIGKSTAPMTEPQPLRSTEPPAQPLNAATSSPLAAAAPQPAAANPGVAALASPFASRAPTAPASAAPAPLNPPAAAAASPIATVSANVPVGSGKDQPYVVAPGDSLFSISQKVYGDGAYYRALFAYNSDRYPHAEDIRSGNVLDVPPLDYLKQRYPDLISTAGSDQAGQAFGRPTTSAGGTYVVREGDTLFDIARKQLGQASRWTELYNLNRAVLGENLENLRPGIELKLP